MFIKTKKVKKLLYISSLIALIGCYSNNCPVMNTVTCNYFFYDSEGNPIKYTPEITVSAILPGGKTVYVYRRLGSPTIVSETVNEELLKEGYTQSTQIQRNDTVLINKAGGQQFLQVPMSYFNKVDTLLLTYSNISRPDTIYVEHESYAHVDLPECGSFRYHSLKSVKATDNAIDHIEIVNSTVNYDQEENIKLYFNGVATNE